MESIIDNVVAARSAFGVTLVFHIVFASLGVVMPFMIMISQWLYLRRGEPVYEALNRKWTTAFALTYAVGAVSGTVLTFGFGLFWPNFMDVAGPVMGYPLAIEVLFFLLEAIFLGIYVFGRGLLRPWVHWLSSIPLFVGGFMSMIVVVLANSWMNTPVGFTLNDAGQVVDVQVIEAMFAPAWFYETSHMTLAAFEAVAFAFAAVYAVGMLRGRRDTYHRRALLLAMVVATVAAPVMILSGDLTAKYLAHEEPAKLAAMEPTFDTESAAPITVGGWPDTANDKLHYAIRLPWLLSTLSFDDPNATVRGLDSFPDSYTANPQAIWWAFDAMVGIGFFLVLMVGWFWFAYWRAREAPVGKWLLRATALSGFLGFLAVELGWVVTEEGRQPWVIKGVMRTVEGVSPAPGLGYALIALIVFYVLLGAVYIRLLKGMADGAPDDLEKRQRAWEEGRDVS